ncbi:MAG: PaaI family thioesterase [Desulfohalobiaceae bacterium]|nr:PaaI family thioesterase [Desulfohalobiaceae bacterium]
MDENNDPTWFTSRDLFAVHIGCHVTRMEEGYAEAQTELEDYHKNGLGMAHGGVIYSLADLAFAAASNSRRETAVSINATISYMRPITSGLIRAEARETASNRKLATYIVTVYDQQDTACAVFQGTVFKKGANAS